MANRYKISEISKQTNVPTSTIRYYVSQGLIPKPEKVNRNMSYYDESCIDKLRAINFLKESRRYPLTIIRNILKRMDQGLSIENAEQIENMVFFEQSEEKKTLYTRQEFLEYSGLTSAELKEAEKFELIIPYYEENNKKYYDHEDIGFGRDVIKNFLDLNRDDIKLKDFRFYVELFNRMIEQEDVLRKKLVKGKSTTENINITMEMIRVGDFVRTYISKRLLQKRTKEKVKSSLEKQSREDR